MESDIIEPFLLLSGFTTYKSAHAINIYIITSHISPNMFDILIINSGDGVRNHGSYDNKLHIGNIIIKYNNISLDTIIKLIKIHHYFKLPMSKKLNLQKILKKNNSDYNTLNNFKSYRDVERLYYRKRSDSSSESDFFYYSIFKIIGSNIPDEIILRDKLQMSGSCSFFATYHYLKYIINDNLLFADFITKMKNDMFIEFVDTFNNVYDNITKKNDLINCSLMLLKNEDLDVELKNRLNLMVIKKITMPNINIGNFNNYNKLTDDDYIIWINNIISYYQSINNINNLYELYGAINYIKKSKYYNDYIINNLSKKKNKSKKEEILYTDIINFIHIIVYKFILKLYKSPIHKINIKSVEYEKYIILLGNLIDNDIFNMENKIYILNYFLLKISPLTVSSPSTVSSPLRKINPLTVLSSSRKINPLTVLNSSRKISPLTVSSSSDDNIFTSIDIFVLNMLPQTSIHNYTSPYININLHQFYLNLIKFKSLFTINKNDELFKYIGELYIKQYDYDIIIRQIDMIKEICEKNYNEYTEIVNINPNIINHIIDNVNKFDIYINTINNLNNNNDIILNIFNVNLFDSQYLIKKENYILNFNYDTENLNWQYNNNLFIEICEQMIKKINFERLIDKIDLIDIKFKYLIICFTKYFKTDIFTETQLLLIEQTIENYHGYFDIYKYFYNNNSHIGKFCLEILYTNHALELSFFQSYIEYSKNKDYIMEHIEYIRYNYISEDPISNYFHNNIYIKTTDITNPNKTYYYLINNKFKKIDIEDDKIINNGYNYIICYEIDKKFILRNGRIDLQLECVKLLYLINKLNLSNIQYNIWFNGDKLFFVEIDNYDIIFYYNTETQILNLIYSNNEYEIIIDNSPIINFWLSYMNNGFIIKNTESIYILIISDSKYILNNIIPKNEYWIGNNNDLDEQLKKILLDTDHDKIHIISFHYTYLTFDFKNDEEFIFLFISLCISKNVFGITLLLPYYYNNKYSNDILKFISTYNIDFPYWALFHKDRPFIKDYHIRKIYLEFNEIELNKFNINFLNDTDDIKLIKELLNYIDIFKKNIINPYNTFVEITDINILIDNFLQDYNYRCIENKDGQPYENDNIYDEYLKIESIIYIDYEIEVFLINTIFTSNKLFNIPLLYSIFYKYFYLKMTRNKFNDILKNLFNIKKNNDDQYGCSILLKTLEYLNINLIYEFDKERSIEDILFELHTSLFIRKEQKEILNIIYDNNEANNNETVYEILMGKGKTSTITPLIILNLYYNKKYNIFNIILPEHLVNDSYNIIKKYYELLIDIIINKDIDDINVNNQVNIISINNYKNYILTNIIETNNTIKNTLFIFDEIDLLIDPLKSELNIPNIILLQDHPNKYIIIDIIINIIKIFIDIKESIFNKSDSIKIDIDIEKKYSVHNDDNIFSKVIKDKMDYCLINLKSKKMNQHFGFGIFNYKNKKYTNYIEYIKLLKNDKNFFIAIPYNANHSPVNGSEFTDFELALTFTTYCYYINIERNVLRVEDLILILDDINRLNKLNFTLAEIYYNVLIINYNEEINYILGLINTTSYYEKCKELLLKINTSLIDIKINIIDTYLHNIIYKNYFKINIKQYNISTIDLLDNQISNNKVMFSGTVNFNIPHNIINELNSKLNDILNIKQIKDIREDIKTKGSIISAILGITHAIPPRIFEYNIEPENELLYFISDPQNLQRYDALIDAGGLILNTSVIDIVEIISSILFDTYILYKDNNEKYICINNIHTKYNNEIFHKLFIYYDHKNCIGVDFKQPYKMHGLITVSNDNNLTQISQAIFRLRNLNIGHTIDYFVSTNLEIGSDVYKLYKILNEREYIYNLYTKTEMMIQCFKYIKRKKDIFNKDNYEEYIYYDTLKYYDEYLSYENFINKEIDNYNLDNVEKIINISIPKISNIKTNIQNAINTENNIEDNIIIKKVIIEINNKSYIDFLEPTIVHIEDYLRFNFDNHEINYNGEKITEFIIGKYQIYFSKLLFRFLFNNSEENKKEIYNNLYYFINIEENKIIIMTIYEYLMIINYINKYKIELPNIIIYNIYGVKVFNLEIEYEIANYIKLLFFDINLDLIKTFDSILFLFMNDKDITFKLELLEILLMKTYYFNINKSLILERNIKIFINNILNLDITNEVLLNKLIKKYHMDTIHKDFFTDTDFHKKYIKYKNKYLHLVKNR